MKNVNNIKKMLLELLVPQLAERGFKRQGSRESFLRKHADRVDVFQLVFLDGKPGWRIQPNAGVRFDTVEDIFHHVSGFEAKYQKDTVTVGAPLGIILGETARGCEFILESDTELESIAREVIASFENIALPYFSNWSNIKNVDSALNDDPSLRVPKLRGGLAWFRCSTGIIIARLTNRKDYDRLVSFYGDVMAVDNNGFYSKRFDLLVKYLKNIEPNKPNIIS